MSAINSAQALGLFKIRLDRLASDTSRDDYFQARIEAAAEEIEHTGIVLTDSTADLMLVVDCAVWHYQNRDSNTGMPPDIRKRILNRWVPGKEASE